MWKLGDVVNLETLLDKAYAKALNQSAGDSNSSWELVERALSYHLPEETVLKEKEELLTRWETLDEIQDMLGIPEQNRTFHKRSEKQLLSMLYRAVKQLLAPDYAVLDGIRRKKEHYLRVYLKLKERRDQLKRAKEAYQHNGWRIPYRIYRDYILYSKATERVWKRYERIKEVYELKRKDVSRKLKEMYEFLPIYLEIIQEEVTPADWRVLNKALS